MILLTLCLGAIVGLLLGLAVSGGSILTLPLLVYLLHMETKEAIVASLAIVGITAFSGFIQQIRQQNICIRLGLLVGVSGILGAFAGSKISFYLSGKIQLIIFACVMICVSFIMFLKSLNKFSISCPKEGCNMSIPSSLFLGSISGFLTGLIGIGGGFIIGPALILNGLNTHLAIGTSLLIITVNCVAGLTGYWGHINLPFSTILTFSASSIIFSNLGARWVKTIPIQKLEFFLAIFILGMGLLMILKNMGIIL